MAGPSPCAHLARAHESEVEVALGVMQEVAHRSCGHS